MFKFSLLLIITLIVLSNKSFSQIYLDNELSCKLELDSLMPTISGTTIDNVTIDSNYFQGKVTLIQFSRAGCAPCVYEYKYLNTIWYQVDSNKLNILGIYPSNKPELQNYIESLKPEKSNDPRKLTHSIYILPKYQIMPECKSRVVQTGCNPISRRYGISGYPVTLIIDKNRIIRQIWDGFPMDPQKAELKVREINKSIEELLKE